MMSMWKLARVTMIVAAPVLFTAACADQGTHDMAAKALANANHAQETADKALATAQQALSTAQAADAKATSASQEAAQASADAKAVNDKLDRMFRKGLRK